MQECPSKPEKPKIGPKPVIASKPKNVPPVNVRNQRIIKDDRTSHTTSSRRTNIQGNTQLPKELSHSIPQTEKKIDYREVYMKNSGGIGVETSIKYDEYAATYISEKCDKYSTNYESFKKIDDFTQKAPNSPSTVCCSILSNATTDCCGIINVNKKELNGQSMSKLDSVDSNSSDSGGFKDFIQLDLTKDTDPLPVTHQRKASQPDFVINKSHDEPKMFGHQRNFSQPDYIHKQQISTTQQDMIRQSFAQQPQKPLPNAQALAQFLPQTEQKLLQHRGDRDDFRQQIAKFNNQSSICGATPPQPPSSFGKSDEMKMKPKPQIIPHSQFQQSTKKLEELLSQRIEREKVLRKGQSCLVDGESSQDVEQKLMIQKQTQQKLQADLQQTVKQIQEIQSIELRLPQNRKWSESNRSQPAIGLKHTPKSRPTIFGTVASDLTPKDCSNRRSLPQTPQTKSYSVIYNGDSAQEKGTDRNLQQDNALVYRDGNLISGSLEALIQHMVPTESYYPDRAYIFAFLLSSRLFIKPHDLLAKIKILCESQQGLGSTTDANIHMGQSKFAEHLVQLLAEWTETFPYDFRDERVMQHVRTITQQCCTINPNLRVNVSSLLHNLLQRLTALEQYEKTLDVSTQPHDENFTDISDICPVPAILAQQLTHVELERLSFIGPEEFVQAFAKENPHLETSFKDMKKTHNLEQYVQWFNRLSYLVATQVCKYQKKKQRVRVVEYWIETGRECFNIGNFNSLMAIIAGLNLSPISRLKKTWNKIHSGKFAILEHQMDPSSNFSSYRSTLKAAMWRSHGAKDQRQRIVIPFFSLLVKDLYFLNQGCSNKLPNGHINFEKFWQLAKQVTEFMAWKQVTCPFEKDPKVISVLQYGPILNENALALASFECEPPENNQEKERCKTLKADNTTN